VIQIRLLNTLTDPTYNKFKKNRKIELHKKSVQYWSN